MTLTRTFKDGNLQIFQNEKRTVTVKHYSAHRGGCLYVGEITIARKTLTSTKVKTMNSTSAPYNPDGKHRVDRDESMLRYLEALAEI